jgi:hypothetical protein
MTRTEHILIMTNKQSKEELQKANKDKEKISWSDWIREKENSDDSKLQRFFDNSA